jgi:uncharacterized protein (TIGR03435 family)
MKKNSFLCGITALLLAPAPTTSLVKASQTNGAGTTAQAQKFDVVSVRPCDPNTAGGGRGRAPAPASLVHFFIGCWPMEVLIREAYVTFEGGRINPRSVRPTFDGHAGPDWIRTERFTIEATTAAATPVPVMHGPMLQAVLEDRFKLKMRRETRDVPIFEVVVAKGGSKLTPSKPGICVPQTGPLYALPPLEPGQHWCNSQPGIQNSDGSRTQIVEALTLDDWLANIPPVSGRPLVNKTGITGLQTFRFVSSTGGRGVGPEFATDIKQLGLELRAAQGPREFLILDHVERPVPDGPVVAPAHATGPGR